MSKLVYNIEEAGAMGDGKSDNTEIFRRVLHDCGEAGGGIVIIPPGRYLTGPFQLFSNTELRVEAGAQILGSPQISAYFADTYSMESGHIGLVYARHAHNITLTGRGEIDFQGTAFMQMDRLTPWVDLDKAATRQGQNYLTHIQGIGDGPVEVRERPGNLLQFLDCQNVALSNITLRNAPNWTVHFGDSQDIFVHQLRILNNLLIANSDGIHCTSCRNVQISDCHIESGDDSIAITTLGASGAVCENVVVSNCTLVSRSAGVRIGYGRGDIRNCLFQNLTIDSNRGLAVFARNNNTISDISFDHIKMQTRLLDGQWWGHGEPIHVSAVRDDPQLPPGQIKNVAFSHITACSQSGILIYASEAGCLSNIRLKEIDLTIENSPLVETYGGNFDLRPAANPAEKLFQHDEGGLFARLVAYLRIESLTLWWPNQPAAIFGYGLAAEDCRNLFIKDFRCPDLLPDNALGQIKLKNCQEWV